MFSVPDGHKPVGFPSWTVSRTDAGPFLVGYNHGYGGEAAG